MTTVIYTVCTCHAEDVKTKTYGDETYSFCSVTGKECHTEDLIVNAVEMPIMAFAGAFSDEEDERTVDAIVGVGDAPEHE